MLFEELPDTKADDGLVPTRSWDEGRHYLSAFLLQRVINYFGDWTQHSDASGDVLRSNTQFNAFEFSFRGSRVRWIGTKRPENGFADIYIDGDFVETVDGFADPPQMRAVRFERGGLAGDRIHTLRVVVRKERHPDAVDCFTDVITMLAEQPVTFQAEIARQRAEEYTVIRAGRKRVPRPEAWSPVAPPARLPQSGVVLGDGPFRGCFERHIAYLNHCAASDTYADGVGWTEWLPGSNEGRMLAGAAGVLRWEERADMRDIVRSILAGIAARQREDGYTNYYPEARSYALNDGVDSERKNYDRVMWSRGMLAAGMIGETEALTSLRRMYDWFNASPYARDGLLGSNATNGLPGGALVYNSPVGRPEDLLTNMRFYDQDYWFEHLANAEPLAMSFYPGERPHCYALLGFEAIVDAYRATGDAKYLNAIRGAWKLYRENFKHSGGATAIMEHHPLFPPKNYFLETAWIGETCGTNFWIEINSKLAQLFPDDVRYAAEIEEGLFNIVLGIQDERGYIRYHNALSGHREHANCKNSCCEVTTTWLMGKLPEYIYALREDGVSLNQFISSTIDFEHEGKAVSLRTEAGLPSDGQVAMTVSLAEPTSFVVRVRMPSWVGHDVAITVNDEVVATGTPDTYVALSRVWHDVDRIAFAFDLPFRTVQYVGLEQAPGNRDRFALFKGPTLLALIREDGGEAGLPELAVSPEELPDLLEEVPGKPLEFRIAGHPEWRYRPYWRIDKESFNCFPIVER